MSVAQSGTAFRDDIQGLRAIAVLAVVAYHAALPGVGGGFAGVDIFFVISGFLITGILRRDIEAKQFSLLNFYDRRIRRIFPALAVVLVATTAASVVILGPDDLVEYGQSVASAALFVSNHFFAGQASYFADASLTKPLLHTWSLAVEEQYYLFFPLLLFVISKGGRWLTFGVILALLGFSFATGIYATWRGFSEAFYWAPFRLWELFVGSLLALGFVPALKNKVAQEIAGLLGLVFLAWTVFVFDSGVRFPGYAAALPVAGAALLIHAGPNTLVAKGLSLRPLVFVGAISYSLYLWHWPILALWRYWNVYELEPWQAATAVAAAFILAGLSWRFVEQPARRRSPRQRKYVFAFAAALLALTVGTDRVVTAADGWPGRVSELSRQLAEQSGEDFRARRRYECFDADETRIDPKDPCVFGAEVTPTFALWGDSHALALSDGLTDLAAARAKSFKFFGMSGCVPIVHKEETSDCGRFNSEVLSEIIGDPAIDTVVMTGRFYTAFNAAGLDSETAALSAEIAALKAAGKKVILAYDVYRVGFSIPAMLAKIAAVGKDPFAFTYPLADYLGQQEFAIKLLDAMPADVTRVHLQQRFCDDTKCWFGGDGFSYFYDGQHLSRYGSKLAAELFVDLI